MAHRKIKRLWVGAFLLAIWGVLAEPYVMHNVRLAGMASRFRGVAHPPESRLLAERRAAGSLVSRHCDYFVGELRVFDGDVQSLTASYRGACITGVGRQREVEVVVLDGLLFPAGTVPGRFAALQEWGVDAATIGSTRLYVVYVLDAGHNGLWDVRCWGWL